MTETTTKRPRLSNAVTKPMATLGMGLILASGTFGAAVAAEGTPTPTTSTTSAAAPADGSAAAKQLPASTVTKVSVDTSSYDVNKNGRLDLTESASLTVDFALPADAKAGDTFTVAVQAPFKLGVSGSGVTVKDKSGNTLGIFEQDTDENARLVTFTVDKGAEGLEDVTGSATLPLQSAATPTGDAIMVTYSINGETAKPTGTQIKPQIGRPGSSSSIIYPAGSNDGTVGVSAVAFATPGKDISTKARDITMVFTPNSDNWHFDPAFKTKYDAGQLKIDATRLSTGTALSKSNVQVVSSSADKIVVKLKDVPTNEGVRVQLPTAAGIGVDDGKPLKLSVTNTGPNVVLAGTPMLSQAAQPNAAAQGAGLLPPTATDDSFEVEPGDTVKIDFLTNDKANQEGATITKGVLFVNGKEVKAYTQKNEGTYTVSEDGKSINFQAAEGFTNKPTTPVSYKVFDSNNKAAVANITGKVKAAMPTANPDENKGDGCEPIIINPLDNDEFGNEGDTWDEQTLTLLDEQGNPIKRAEIDERGVYTVENGKIVFTPVDACAYGEELPEVPYQITDSNGNLAKSTARAIVPGEAPRPEPTETATETPEPTPSETATEAPSPEPSVTESKKPASPTPSPTESSPTAAAPNKPAKPASPAQQTLIETGFAAQNGDGGVTPTPLGYAALAAAVAVLGGLGYSGYRLIRKNQAQ